MNHLTIKSFLAILLLCLCTDSWAQSNYDYAELGEKTRVSADSTVAVLQRYMQREQDIRESDRVEASVLATLLSLQTSDSLSRYYHDLALRDMDALAKAHAKDYPKMVRRMPLGKYFHDDLLSIVGYELGEYDLLHDYYQRHGNREAAMLCALESLRLRPDRAARKAAGSSYLQTLDSLTSRYADLDLSAELAIERWTFMNRATDVTDEEKVEFLKTNTARYRRYPRTNILVNAYNELTKAVVVLEAPTCLYTSADTIHFTLKYKNVNHSTLKIYRTNYTNRDFLEERYSGYYSNGGVIIGKDRFRKFKKKYKLSELTSRRQRIELDGNISSDQKRQTFRVDPLPVGIYVLELTSRAANDTPTLRHLLMVSDVRTLIVPLPGDSCMVTAVDAINGQPLNQAYYQREDEEPLTITGDGVVVESDADAVVYTDGDHALPPFNAGDQSFFIGMEEDDGQVVAELMSDRRIYRPGQTVHLALVAYRRKGCETQVVSGQSFVISLRNPQGKEIDSLVVTTDDYGTAHVDHRLPQLSPLGDYSFRVDERRSHLPYDLAYSPYCVVKVEEYKRPTFKVSIDDNKDVVRIGDMLHVRGRAATITGEPLRHATVAWTADIMSTRDWHRLLRNASDTVQTDHDGLFAIDLPITSQEPYAPTDDVYRTKIHAYVTDSRGESHDVEKNYRFSQKGVTLQSNVDGRLIERNDLQRFTFRIRATNFCGKDVQVPIIHLLDGERGDSCSFLAPHLEVGRHTLTIIHEGDTLQQRFVVYDRQAHRPCIETDSWMDIDGDTFDMSGGTPTSVWIGSSQQDVNIFYTVYTADGIIDRGQLLLSDSIIRQDFTYKEAYGDGITILYSWYKDGKLHNENTHITCPKPDKQLVAQWTTFRDKVVPGNEETWLLRLTHPDGRPADARMIASLYDHSLDELSRHDWSWNTQLVRRKASVRLSGPRSSIYTTDIAQVKHRRVDDLHMSWLNFGLGAQGKTVPVSGRVTDGEGEPLIGVSVMVDGSRTATVTDLDGRYSLMAPAGERLTFAYVGYGTKRLHVIANTLNVTLEEDDQALDEVVVVGYGVSKMTERKHTSSVMVRGTSSTGSLMYVVDGVLIEGEPDIDASNIVDMTVLKGDEASRIYGAQAANGVVVITTNQHVQTTSPAAQTTPLSIAMRENLSETAFFYPSLRTDADGQISIAFTLPESITSWQFLGSAHTREMDHTIVKATTTAKKDLMVQPNMPRFLRANDRGTITASVRNTSDKPLTGTATLQLVDPENDRIVFTSRQPFSVKADGTANITFGFTPGAQTPALLACKIGVSAGAQSDGEQHYLPILPDTEPLLQTLPFTLTEPRRAALDVKALFPAGTGDQRLTLEYTNHPAWLMIQALHEYAHPVDDCSLCQAMALFTQDVASCLLDQPSIRPVVEQWRNESDSTTTLLSALQRNDEVKHILLAETPWTMAADKESDQKRQLIDLLDQDTMGRKHAKALGALQAMQHGDGSWGWFPGMNGSTLITSMVTELLVRRNVLCGRRDDSQAMLDKAFAYLDRQGADLHYLYLCALDGRQPSDSLRREVKRELKALRREAKDNDISNIYRAAVEAIVLHAFKQKGAEELLDQIMALTVSHPERGRYFDSYLAPYSWCDYKIPTQVMVVEALQRIRPTDRRTIDEMRLWLLQEKRSQYWATSIQAANTIYAFLHGSMESMADAEMAEIDVDGRPLDTGKATAPLGYLKTGIDPEGVHTIHINKQGEQTAWGALYAQYTQRSKEVESSGSDLKVKREIIAPHQGPLKVGDKVRVRITLSAARDLDFVQVNDRRAACLEPVDPMSGYANGYYVYNRDCATQYFITMLSKGSHVIDKEYYVDRAGTYQSGTVTAQCAYAPEYVGTGRDYELVVE